VKIERGERPKVKGERLKNVALTIYSKSLIVTSFIPLKKPLALRLYAFTFSINL